MKNFFIFICFILLFNPIFSQSQFLFLKPDSATGKDISVWNNTIIQQGNSPQLDVYAWTNNGLPGLMRAYLYFDISSIPVNSVIVSASLSLFFNPTSVNGQHSQLSGSNEAYIKRVISPWDEQLMQWHTQPGVSSQNQVIMPASLSPTQNYTVDVTALVQDMVNAPASSFGFNIRLVTEQYYRSIIFASSDNPDSTLWPELFVEYIPSQEIVHDTCMTLKPDAKTGKDISVWNNTIIQQGNSPQLDVYAWTNSGQPGFLRAYIDFNFSYIPANAHIISATLKLFFNPTSVNGQHSQLSGSNEAYIKRVISPWDEQVMQWNTQPNVSSQNEVIMPASDFPTQNYIVDVTALVQDIMNDSANSYGFNIRMVTEQYYRKLIFASSDNPDSTLWPEIEICWQIPNSSDIRNEKCNTINVYPNPTHEIIFYKIPDNVSITEIKIYSITGVLIKNIQKLNNNQLNISDLNKGIYILRFTANKNNYQQKIVKL